MQSGITSKTLLLLLALTVVRMGGPAPALSQDRSTHQTPASAISSMKVEGELIRVEGRYYVIKNTQGKEMYLLVGPDTELAGPFKPGDRIDVWTSPIEHAIAIRSTSLVQESDRIEDRIEMATHSFKGKLIGIEGKYYVVVGADGKEIRLLVNQNTELAGEFRPGDQIEVFTSPVEHAVAIKSAK
ncbi:MAG: hypothetical protein Q8N00_01525 [Nitrospirota bacterium]|nr:hypothetical protein [Nitrospirota bacterium]MDP3597453.1 hypothetical protein [Nitrospirota bacterium]